MLENAYSRGAGNSSVGHITHPLFDTMGLLSAREVRVTREGERQEGGRLQSLVSRNSVFYYNSEAKGANIY